MDPWHIASGGACIVAAVVLSIIVLHPGIREGAMVKVGLVSMILSLWATAALTFSGSTDWPGYWRAAFTLRAGLALTCIGIIWKAHSLGCASRRAKDQAEAHKRATNRWLYVITEPARDMANLFRDERDYEKDRT